MDRRLVPLARALSCALAVPLAAQTPPAVSPADRATLEGSKWTSYPLGRHDCRVQQLHADLGATARSIAGHAYRRDAISTRGSVGGYQAELSVVLSMSPRTPDTASPTFADNHGTTVTVLPRTWVSFPATARPGQAPANAFDYRIPYATPFSYPGGGGVLCIDTTVHDNMTGSGPSRNFSAYLDAHEQFPDGRALQPGYRYGQGCAPSTGGRAAYANFEMRTLPTGMEFDIRARNGVPSDASGSAMSALITGFRIVSRPWALQPGCTQLVSMDAVWPLAGANDPSGAWNGTLSGFAILPTGLVFHAQIASGHPKHGVALSDASTIVVPPPGPMPITAVRIANGSNGAAATGTVSPAAPVTELF